MARLFIVETDILGYRDGELVPVARLGSSAADLVYQSVSFTDTAGTSAAIQKKYLRLKADAACHVSYGETAVSTAGSEKGILLAAQETEYVEVTPGSTISVVTAA